MKRVIIALIAVCAAMLFADTAHDVQTVDGAQRNRLFSKTGDNTLTGSNVFMPGALNAYDIQILTNAGGSSGVGRISWNDTDKTLEFGNSANVTLQLGQEQHLYARNAQGGGTTISNGHVVYISGATGSRASCKLANSTNAATAHATIGISTEDIANGQVGFISTFGLVRDVNTVAFDEGDQLYLGTVDGQLTNAAPAAPNHHVRVGTVVRKNASSGSIFVDVHDNGTVQELADVVFTPATGSSLIYNAGGFWTNQSYVKKTGDTSTGSYYFTSANISIGTNTDSTAKLFVGGESGVYTNKPLVVLNRTTAGTGPILQWQTNGVPIGSITVDGTLSVTGIVATGSSFIPMPHYMAATTNTLTNPATNAANVITWTDIAHTYRFRTVGSKIYATEVGTFLINASIIMASPSAENTRGSIWFAVNGTNIPGSATQVSFPSATGGTVVTNMAQVISVPVVANNNSTNDYLEVYWWANDTSVTLSHTPVGASPARPSSPAAILTINKISAGAGN